MTVERIRFPPDSECCDSLFRTKCIKFAYAERQRTLALPWHFMATVMLLLAVPVHGKDWRALTFDPQDGCVLLQHPARCSRFGPASQIYFAACAEYHAKVGVSCCRFKGILDMSLLNGGHSDWNSSLTRHWHLHLMPFPDTYPERKCSEASNKNWQGRYHFSNITKCKWRLVTCLCAAGSALCQFCTVKLNSLLPKQDEAMLFFWERQLTGGLFARLYSWARFAPGKGCVAVGCELTHGTS